MTNNLTEFLIIYFAWNIVVFLVYGADKRKAKKKVRRISEKALLLCAFFMGGLGAALGMAIFRHKTKHLKFCILTPLAILLNVAVIYGIWSVF